MSAQIEIEARKVVRQMVNQGIWGLHMEASLVEQLMQYPELLHHYRSMVASP
ncbi:MAG: hypothetical protein VX610_06610 [SAR324 cluster bacterium]|nr:hypothetical protein [SAR324 cluster bacterium]